MGKLVLYLVGIIGIIVVTLAIRMGYEFYDDYRVEKEVENEIHKAFSENDFFKALKEYYPYEYQALSNKVKKGYKLGLSNEEIVARNSEQVREVFASKIPKASDTAMIYYSNVYLEILSKTKRFDIETCDRLASGYPLGNIATKLDKEQQISLLNAMSQIIKSSALKPHLITDEKKVRLNLIPIFQGLQRKYNVEVTENNEINFDKLSKDESCQLEIDFVTEVLRLPPSESADALRIIFQNRYKSM